MSMGAILKCLNDCPIEIWLRPILWDIISTRSDENANMNIINSVKRAVDTILNRIRRMKLQWIQ